MNALNNILLRIEDFSPLYILFIDFLTCSFLSVFIYILSYMLGVKHQNTIKYTFIKSVQFIGFCIVWMYFIKTCVDLPIVVYLPNYKDLLILYSDKAFDFCIYLAVIVSLFKFIKKSKVIFIERKIEKTHDGYEDFKDINAIFKAFEIGAGAISILLILAALQVSPTALGAFSGVALAGLTLSQGTLLTNLSGGLFVIFNRKYSEGDIIVSDINSSIKFKGTIKKIGTLTTRVDSFETAPMHIPNSVFLNTCVTTVSRRTHRRLLQYITINYENISKVEIIKDKILTVLKSHSEVDQTKTLAVSLVMGGTTIGNKSEGSFGSNGINIQVYAMISKVLFVEFLAVQDKVFLDIARELDALGVSFAVNTAMVKIEGDNS